ncbi:3'-5' exonuclease [Symbiopectobacterium purcellii]|uniref:3'-5' exonuclease n=1 Tax=Symbiopectobacterium purcellii TaxID=2871826 RepID=UPI003F875BCA
MNHVMIDLETLGTNPNAPIASIGAVFFDPNTGGLGEQFYCHVDFESDMKNGAAPDGDTIKWWLRQSAEARAELIRDDMCPIWAAVSKFSDWLTENAESLDTLQVWANSPSFDCIILKSAFERTDTDIPWNYRNERDVRTIKEVGFALGVDVRSYFGIPHNAIYDAINQAVLVSAIVFRLAQNQGGEL